jgi:alpha-tubulin suppressor-like RCC1 family protein
MKRQRTKAAQIGAVMAGAAIIVLQACEGTEPPCCDPPDPPSESPLVSEPLGASVTALSKTTASSAAIAAAERLVYVSLPTGAQPGGRTAIIRNTAGGPTFSQPMIDGGFDPVAIPAGVGDTVAIDIRDDPVVLASIRRAIPRRRPPRVVRTNPPKGKRDVALNSRMTIIFSEPVAAHTLTTSSITLSLDGTRVAGVVEVLAGGLAADFVPSAPLAPRAAYQLSVTRSVSDAEGDVMEEDVTVQFETGTTSRPAVTSVEVAPSAATLEMGDVLGDSVQLVASVRTSQGVVTDREVLWATSDARVAIVSSAGLVKARNPGRVTIAATSEGRVDSAAITVVPIPVAGVSLTPMEPRVDVGGTVFVAPSVTDRNDQILTRREVTFESSDVNVASVDQRGLVTGIAPGTVTITATSEGVSGTATIPVGGPLLADRIEITPEASAIGAGTSVQLSARAFQCDTETETCSVIDNPPVGWTSSDPAVATIDGTGRLTALAPGTVEITAGTEDARGLSTVTVLNPSAVTWSSISAGYYFTCGLTATGHAYCWGQNVFGQLGIGTHLPLGEQRPGAVAPVSVAGGLSFSSLTVGGWHACGLTGGGGVYCWGLSLQHQAGPGDAAGMESCEFSAEHDTPCARMPVRVDGVPPVNAVFAGGLLTCALTSVGTAYCWGGDRYGQIGDAGGTTFHGLPPTPVAGSHVFTTLAVGWRHVCGLTPDGQAYCWGYNFQGQLGDGTTENRDEPTAVAGDVRFAQLTTLGLHTCGVTSGGDAYCWGDNYYGQLGDGSVVSRTTPVRVQGGPFAAVRVGEFHTCGLTADGVVHCWGANWFGELGDGSRSRRSNPMPIAGAVEFTAITTGASHACALARTNAIYCWGLNESGQLGDGTAADRTSPVRVVGQP